MRFLITGGSGFIGKRFSKKLLEKYGNNENEFVFIQRNRGIKFIEEYKNKTKIVLAKGDIADISSIGQYFKGIDFVFHLAAKVNYGDPDKGSFYKINVEGTKNIFELSLKNKVKKVIYLSTAAIYHPAYEKYIGNTEPEKPIKHLTSYSRTKYLAHELCKSYSEKGLKIVSVLPSSVFDYRAPLFHNFILRCVEKGSVVTLKKRSKLSFVLLDNVVNFVIFCLGNNKFDNKDVFLSEEDMTMLEFTRRIEKILDKKIIIFRVNNNILKILFVLQSLFIKIFKIRTYYNYELFQILNGNFLVKGVKLDKILDKDYIPFNDGFNKIIIKYKNKYNKKC